MNQNHNPNATSNAGRTEAFNTAGASQRRLASDVAVDLLDQKLARLAGHRPATSTERLESMRELLRRPEITGAHRDALLASIEYARTGAFPLAHRSFEIVAQAIDEQTKHAAKVAAASAQPANIVALVEGLGRTAGSDTAATRSLAHSLLTASEHATTVPQRRVREAIDGLTFARDEISAELRRSAAAAGISSPAFTPTEADWREGLGRVHEQAEHPSWFALVQRAASMPNATHAQVAIFIEQLTLEHARAGRFLRAFWARELRLRLAVLGVNTLEAPSEVSAALVVGVFAKGG